MMFNDYSAEVLEALHDAAVCALEKCGLTAEGYAKRLCPVDTGELRNSISYTVDEAAPAVYIGTNVSYAPYVELGTGVYTSGGSPTPWVYRDEKGERHMTNGQRAQPFLKPAISDYGQTYRNIIDSTMKNG